MTGRNGGAPAVTGARAAAATAANLAAKPTGQPDFTRLGQFCQSPPSKLPDLAEQAAIRAEVAGILAEAYQAAGDRAGFDLWQRRRLAHQAVYWAATHPPYNEVGQ